MRRPKGLDPLGLVQLVAMGVLGAAVGVCVSFAFVVESTRPVQPLSVFLVLAGTAAGLAIQLFTWHREGGRQAVRDTNLWIRNRAIPAAVPEEEWRKRLIKREFLARREWFNVIAGAIWIALSVARIYSDPTPPASTFWSWTIAFWLALAARTLYYNLRWLPVIRTLLATPEISAGAAQQPSPTTV